MKKILFNTIFSIIFVISLFMITNVKAYEENTFTNGKCIADNSYLTSATTGYSLNESGTYSLTGKTYTEYSNSNEKNNYVFYIVSNDSKVLYGLVPNYNATLANDKAKSAVFSLGIETTANCNDIYVMEKTVIGNPPSNSSYINFGRCFKASSMF